jgi:N-methylhydantoinase A
MTNAEDIGVDTGGTFTDVVTHDDAGLKVYKQLSTPEDPSRAIGEGVDAILAEVEGSPRPSERLLIHGTTVATNALLEREGARLAFVTTSGFEDILELRRQHRPSLYDLDIQRSAPLCRSEDCFGIEERISGEGEVLAELDPDSVESVIEAIRRRDIGAVAVCLLHAYADDTHERRVVDTLREALDIPVSASHEVAKVFREYERASTTAVNGYVAPTMKRYLERLDSRVACEDIQILQSSGGRVDIDHASRFPVHTVLSGPAGGVVGARAAAGHVGIDDIMTLDMGGTSTDVSLCSGDVSLSQSATIDDLPIQIPAIDIHTVGAGGGSIGHLDPGGGLRVGPQSAGADPGPACYGRGAEDPTVTDAHVVLGRLRPDAFLGGDMQLDLEAAHAAVGGLADEAELAKREAARGILEVADAKMTRALKVISLEQGHDPRDFSLVAFGGAGALHGCRLAERLGMRRVIVPVNPGVLSAWGMLHASFQRLVEGSILEPLDAVLEAPRRLERRLDELVAEAVGDLDAAAEAFDWDVVAQLRYEGQSYEVDVPVDWPHSLEDPSEEFERRHERLYGYRATDRNIELVGLRLRATQPRPDGGGVSPGGQADGGTEATRATVGFKDGDLEADILSRAALEGGEAIDGPAVVTEYSATTVIPPGWRGTSKEGHLVIEREES